MAGRPLLNRSFSTREKGLILGLVLVALVALYYFGVVQNVANTKEANMVKKAEIEQQIAVQKAQAVLYKNMQAELDALPSQRSLPIVATYDNVRNELDELNGVLASTSAYNVSFDQPVASGETVRRPAKLTYTVKTYDEALDIVSQLLNGKYRCEVTDFSFNGKMLSDGSMDTVSATLNLVFFETTNGASNLSGLTTEKK